MGGWAPNCSSAGMFKSSMKNTKYLPSGGPKMPLRRLSSFESIRSWVWLEEVLAEKFRNSGVKSLGIVLDKCKKKQLEICENLWQFIDFDILENPKVFNIKMLNLILNAECLESGLI